MKNIVLINAGKIPHYRVPVYNYLRNYLKNYDFNLNVVSEGTQESCPHKIQFPYTKIRLCFKELISFFVKTKPDVVIFWVGPKLHIFLILIMLKVVKVKVIHWGHRRPMHNYKFIKQFIYNFEHWLDDAIILYAEQLRQYVSNYFQSKTFIANNTLNLTIYNSRRLDKEKVKNKYGVFTSKNIICMGRMQRRKRVEDLIKAFQSLDMKETGLIIVGPDIEGILENIDGRNIFKLGPVYGEERIDLLSASDVYCLPGSIGLSIVDAFYCGLPVITENVTHGPEIMYLYDGINGFIVPKGDTLQLADKLKLLLMDDALREKFSKAAKKEIMTSGHIDRMCEGFKDALQYVFK